MPGVIQETNTISHHGFVFSRRGVLAVMLFVIPVHYSDAMSQTLNEGNISSSGDCTEITIGYTIDSSLTREEAISRMDKAFYESLNRYDACQTSQSASSNGASGSSGDSGAAGQAASGDGAGTDAGGTASLTSSVASPNLSGTETTISDSSISAAAKVQKGIASKAMDKSIKKGKTGDMQMGSGKIPEDIPPADNDSVLEAQIRQAAMNETDPRTRERLWREYRKYKGLPQPADQATISNEE